MRILKMSAPLSIKKGLLWDSVNPIESPYNNSKKPHYTFPKNSTINKNNRK